MTIRITRTELHTDEFETEEFEDVASYEMTENIILLKLNTGELKAFSLRDNDGVGEVDWKVVEIECERVMMRVSL